MQQQEGGGVRLAEDEKAFIVMCWARFMSAMEIVRAYNEAFGKEIDLRKVHAFNPAGSRARSTANGKGLDKWQGLYAETRKAFIEDIEAIPIAHAAYRLRELGALYIKMRDKGAVSIAADLLEQAAKESGGAFTNTHKVQGNLKVKTEDAPAAMSVEEQVALVTAAIEEAMTKKNATGGATTH